MKRTYEKYTDNKLLKEYNEIERIYDPWLDMLQNSVDKESGQSVDFETYKGFQTLQGHLVKKPLVLFIGLNPGQGRYNTNNKNESEFPEPLKGPRSNLFCYKRNSLRKDNGLWFDKTKPYQEHNTYVRKFVKLMDSLADELGLKDLEIAGMKGSDEVPNGWMWSEWIQDMVMCTNLFPFSTTNESDLNKLLREMRNSPNAPDHQYKGKRLWEFENAVFVKPMKQLIQLVEPRVVVCLSKKVFHNLTGDGNKTKADANGLLLIQKEKSPIFIGIHRWHGWWVNENEGLPKLAKLIASYK